MGRTKAKKGSSSVVAEPILTENACFGNPRSLSVIDTGNGATEVENRPHSYALTTSKRPREQNATPVRRSDRLRHSLSNGGDSIVEVGILQIKGAGEEGNSDIPEMNTSPEQRPGVEHHPSNFERGRLDEKLEYLVEAVKEFKAEIFGEQNGGSSSSYKVMYMEAQKKIDALVEANYELVKKLQFASGKVEAFQSIHHAIFGPPEKVTVAPGIVRASQTMAKSPRRRLKNPNTCAGDDGKSNGKQPTRA